MLIRPTGPKETNTLSSFSKNESSGTFAPKGAVWWDQLSAWPSAHKRWDKSQTLAPKSRWDGGEVRTGCSGQMDQPTGGSTQRCWDQASCCCSGWDWANTWPTLSSEGLSHHLHNKSYWSPPTTDGMVTRQEPKGQLVMRYFKPPLSCVYLLVVLLLASDSTQKTPLKQHRASADVCVCVSVLVPATYCVCVFLSLLHTVCTYTHTNTHAHILVILSLWGLL